MDKTPAPEQYKSLESDVGSVGTRYATANGFYLSVLTALLGVLACVGAGKPIGDTSYPVILLVAVFAIVICANLVRHHNPLRQASLTPSSPC